jgi:hypothetical protein
MMVGVATLSQPKPDQLDGVVDFAAENLIARGIVRVDDEASHMRLGLANGKVGALGLVLALSIAAHAGELELVHGKLEPCASIDLSRVNTLMAWRQQSLQPAVTDVATYCQGSQRFGSKLYSSLRHLRNHSALVFPYSHSAGLKPVTSLSIHLNSQVLSTFLDDLPGHAGLKVSGHEVPRPGLVDVERWTNKYTQRLQCRSIQVAGIEFFEIFLHLADFTQLLLLNLRPPQGFHRTESSRHRYWAQ